jgi:surface polysaccharide O-acyltransferase-like enzyme
MRPTGSIDFIKSLAVIGVVSGHAVIMEDETLFCAFASPSDGIWHFFVFLYSQVIRFAVPFFFVISGYLWGQKSRKGVILDANSPVVIKRAKRIFFVAVAWSLIYLFPFDQVFQMFSTGLIAPVKIAYWRLLGLLNNPLRLATEGSKVHLWYLLSLLWAIGITSLLAGRKLYRLLIVFSIILFVIGALGKPYASTTFGFYTDFDTRNGPFFSTVFFVTGYFISFARPNTSWAVKGGAIFLLGFVVHLTELYLLWSTYHISLRQDYVFGTYLMGLGAAMVALSRGFSLKNDWLIANIGVFALGIYAIHLVFVDLLKPIGQVFSGPVWSVAYVVSVIVLSLVSSKVLSRYRLTREIVQ